MVQDLIIVAIGRNEGDRLKACLASALSQADTVVYVDSGSNDGSVEYAENAGAHVVVLDPAVPFTAARARNCGFHKAMELRPDVKYVQFVDGDCRLHSEWIARASSFLDNNPRVAAVCGQRRERFPERSIYNQLCDWEWSVPAGPAKYCGGDVMMRADALLEANGYRDSMIAGEEPELCVRLRFAGWKIHVLADEMTRHDAAMTRFGQWWNRTKRSGYAFAAGAWLHGRTEERFWVKQCLRAWIWGVGPPMLVLVLFWSVGVASLLVLTIYPIQVVRLMLRFPGKLRDRFWRAYFSVLSRIPELMGQLQFLGDVRTGRTQLIEYK